MVLSVYEGSVCSFQKFWEKQAPPKYLENTGSLTGTKSTLSLKKKMQINYSASVILLLYRKQIHIHTCKYM